MNSCIRQSFLVVNSGRLRRHLVYVASVLVLFFFLFLLLHTLYAAGGQVDPDGAGNTTQGTPTTCTAGGNYECVNDGVSSSSVPSTSGDYIDFSRDQFDSYQMGTISGVDTVSQIEVFLYHQEGGANMQFEVELWNAAETTQIGSSITISNRAASGWDSAVFSGLSLSQSELDGLRIRTTCLRTGGGPPSTCRDFAMYAYVTYTPTVNVTVGALGSQQNLSAGTTTAHVGGAFSIIENTGSRSITSITISASGTIDRQTDLDNIKLVYDLDTTFPYDCASESYGGGETQFGSTDTDGFSAAGTSTFSGSVSITTTQAMCVYTVLDVSNNASAQETLDIYIANPKSDVVGSGSPVISPGTEVAISAVTTIQKVELDQIHYHWRNDDGTEAGATSATGGSEDAVLGALSKATTTRLRMEVSNEGNQTSGATQYRIEYAQKAATCAAATGWTDVGAGGGDFDMSDVLGITDGSNTTNVAVSTGGVTDENSTFLIANSGFKDTSSQTGSITLTSSEFVELEYAIEATTDATEGTTYCFRLIDGSASSTLDVYSVYPEATISADLTVSATGTQSATETIPTNDIYAGGTFVIVDNVAGANTITDITLSASGTVDLINDINNITLRYDLDTSSPYNCVGESYSIGDTQFGSTDTDGFSAAGTSTFSGSVSVTPTQTLCLYVEYDLGSGASDGETFDIFINNPGAEVVAGSASVAPSAPVAINGVTTFITDVPTQIHYHFRNDNGGEATSTSATGGTQDTVIDNLALQTPIRVRFEVSNEGGATTPAMQYRIEYTEKVSTCAAATGWTDVGAGGGDFDMFNSSNLTDGNNTTNIAVATGGVTDENSTFLSSNGGQKDTSSQTGSITLASDEFVELEYSIEATVNAVEGATYCLRLTDAGTAIAAYSVYPEVTIKPKTDFFVQRGVTTISGGSATITAGVNYIAPSASTTAFIRITNTHHTGAGDSSATGNQNADDVTAYISNPSNITNSITFTRAAGAANDTRVYWEIIEYRGAAGGENEMIVRQQQTVTYDTATTGAAGPTVASVADNNDVVVFIIGQFNPDTGRNDYNTGLSTAAWDATSSVARFTRGEAGADAVVVSYAVVEFTGSNWKTQRSEHTYTSAGTTETESITAVGSLTKAFLHTQKRVGSGLQAHEDFGHEIWLSSVGQISYRLDPGANTPGGHTSVAWVIENTQAVGDVMEVSRSSGVQSGGTAPLTDSVNIGKTLDDLSVSSIFMNNRSDGTAANYPEPMIGTGLISTTQYEIWVSNTTDTRTYRTEVVEWPTARRKITQNYYRLYVDNDALDPTDPWPVGGDDLGENAEMTGFDQPIGSGQSIRIRMTLQVSAATMIAGIDAFKLQYGERTTTCTAISEANWKNLGATGSTTALWRAHAGTPSDGTALSGDPPTAGDLNISVSDVAGTYEEENNTALTPHNVTVGEDVEFDWAIENNGAKEKTDYCFRMIEADGTGLLGYNFYPVIRTIGFGVESRDWIWYDDAENETPTSTLAATNTAPIDIDFDNMIQLRLTLEETNGGTENNTKFRLQFSEYANFSTSTDVVATSSCTDNSLWCYADGGGFDNATITEKKLADADACSGGSGAGCGTHNENGTSTSNFAHVSNEKKEYAFTIRQAGARVNRTYFFRVYDYANDEVVPLATGKTYPSLSTAGAALTFTTTHVASSTVTEGITTDIATTPTSVQFASVVANTELEGAQRITVDVNGTEGYKVYVYTTGVLTNGLGTEIDPVTGTNAAPTAWATGCDLASSTGCFGYHSGDDSLEGGSARFAPDDTYARLDGIPREIMFSSQPVIQESTDIIYKIEVGVLQEIGAYESGIAYIITPIF